MRSPAMLAAITLLVAGIPEPAIGSVRNAPGPAQIIDSPTPISPSPTHRGTRPRPVKASDGQPSGPTQPRAPVPAIQFEIGSAELAELMSATEGASQ
jgi:hypothetical protein